MASGILDADKISKGKSKWGEGNKVYTRRFKRGIKNTAAPAPVPASADPATVSVTSSFPPATVASPSTTRTTTANLSPPTTTANNNQTLATQDANSEKQQTVSDDHSVQNRQPESSEPTGNGLLRPVVTFVDNRVRIDLKAAASNDEIIELREQLRAELNQVRRLAQKLEDKEAELTANSTILGDSYSHSYSGNNITDQRALIRGHSEMAPSFIAHRAFTRPFRPQIVDGVREFIEKEKRTPKANQYYRNSDFLLGKDRLPPESNKRHKPVGARKLSKEPEMFRSCSNLLQRLMKHKHGWVFNEPVNAKLLGLHDYHDIIKNPMDLGTIKSRLVQSFYKSPIEFAEDVRLTFHNAMTYNPKGQDVHVMAEQLSNIFEERWLLIMSDYNQDWRHATPTPRKIPIPIPVSDASRQKPAQISRKKPKAKDPNKRNMTYEEKQRLSANLQSLPSEKLDNILQIIKKNTSLSQHEDEIEVDIDSVDVETLWELDRFVMNYRKSLSKHKRKAELAQQARLQAANANCILNPEALIPDNKACKFISDGASRSSGSSSSSSDSGSSSSDSDSDSSSADGSDAGHLRRC